MERSNEEETLKSVCTFSGGGAVWKINPLNRTPGRTEILVLAELERKMVILFFPLVFPQ
jgi:hypothetical protein